ncbi:MarR family transcriptional regulator [Catenulispora pinisilvae]|uniref:MarR family transcriptional regulator n=1 Tax=Catenulispora pinisilvae TaxID=2705253 RepID=UPI001891153E|nr:helix-turn-helix domain-containing protein [Catenulispora pinisilvae]
MNENQIPESVESLSPGRRAVLATLMEFPETTVIALSDAAQVPRSSTAAALKYLEDRGLATRKIFPILDGKPRPADIWSATTAAGPLLSGNAETGTEQDDAEPVSEQKSMPDRLYEALEHGAAQSVAAVVSEPTSDGTVTAPPKEHMGRGVLRETVLQHMLANSGTTFTPTALSKALGKSAGAISNALDVLVAHGAAVMVLEKPRTFQAPESSS